MQDYSTLARGTGNYTKGGLADTGLHWLDMVSRPGGGVISTDKLVGGAAPFGEQLQDSVGNRMQCVG